MSQQYPPASPAPYGRPPHGQAGYGQPQFAPGYGAPAPRYAHWIKRVAATLLDGLVYTLAGIPMYVGIGLLFGTAESTRQLDGTTTYEDFNPAWVLLIVLGGLLMLGVWVWNYGIRQGRTGQTIGKSALGIRLTGEADRQPPGVGMCILRYFVHIVDGFCYIGYLWPLWDPKRQTFADKILSTVVIDRPRS